MMTLRKICSNHLLRILKNIRSLGNSEQNCGVSYTNSWKKEYYQGKIKEIKSYPQGMCISGQT